jgi:hypothetical protein
VLDQHGEVKPIAEAVPNAEKWYVYDNTPQTPS